MSEKTQCYSRKQVSDAYRAGFVEGVKHEKHKRQSQNGARLESALMGEFRYGKPAETETANAECDCRENGETA